MRRGQAPAVNNAHYDPIPSDDRSSLPPAPNPHTPSHLSNHNVHLLLPAVLSSVFAGVISPLMAYVVGRAFAAFAAFPQTNPTPDDCANLLHGVSIAALHLVALALGSFVSSSLMSSLWIRTAEQNLMALRQKVYDAISCKDVAWFAPPTPQIIKQLPVSWPNLPRMLLPFPYFLCIDSILSETDNVRAATSLAAGQLIQYLTTCLACLLLAVTHSWSLTLVILSAVPLLTIIQSLSQILSGPLLASERSTTATAATEIDHAVTSISTVKAFNAEAFELATISSTFDTLSRIARTLNIIWGATTAVAQFAVMAMFVQGFWYGAKLVDRGKISSGDVITVFWACLIATNNPQMYIPQILALSKGKSALAALVALMNDEGIVAPPPDSISPAKGTLPEHRRSRSVLPLNICPAMCVGRGLVAGCHFYLCHAFRTGNLQRLALLPRTRDDIHRRTLRIWQVHYR